MSSGGGPRPFARSSPNSHRSLSPYILLFRSQPCGSRNLTKPQRFVDEYFDAHPDRLVFVERAVVAHWGTLTHLDPDSKSDWLRGCWMLWWSPPAWEWIDLAPVLFARATERELRRAIFDRFINQADGNKLDALASRQHSEKSREFWTICLRGNGRVALGQMLYELFARSRGPLSNELDAWIRKEVPGLLQFSKDQANKIKAVRDPSVHASTERPTTEAVEKMCRACQRLLSLIHGGKLNPV